MPPAIEEATIAWREDGTAWSSAFGDVYHPAQGALQQAEQVFLHGNGLPERWRGRADFVVLETGFGLGNNFLATWQAWRADPGRPTRLHYLALEAHPPRPPDLRRAHAASPLRERADELLRHWPPPSPDLHRIDLEHGALRLTLAWGDALAWLRALRAQVDAFYLDGFAPQRNPQMWSAALFLRLGRLAAPGATAATWSAARVVRDGLAAAGLQPERAAGPPGKRDITIARYAPVFQAPLPAAWGAPRGGPPPPPGVLVIGAGLAGCAAVRSLARLGWPCTLLDAAEAPARGASANAAGLFHASFSAPDGRHAQWHRAAASAMHAWAVPALGEGRLCGQAAGLLQLQPGLDDAAAQRLLARAGLPASLVDWLGADDARARTGLPGLPGGGWWFGQGGWLSPAEVARAWLDEARRTGLAEARFGLQVHALRRSALGWQALGTGGEVLAEAGCVVLANALDALRLLGRGEGEALAALPFEATRGQVTQLGAHPGVRPPRVPVAGAGYAIGLHDGGLLCGATRRPLNDGECMAADADPRADDHRANLMQAAALGAVDAAAIGAWLDASAAGTGPLSGRCGLRLSAVDRLPWVGPLPDPAAIAAARAGGARLDALRHLPRLQGSGHGLYLLAALGSRGLTSALLAGELLAHWITQTPSPVGAPLCDALDPARHTLRQARRNAAPEPTAPGAAGQPDGAFD